MTRRFGTLASIFALLGILVLLAGLALLKKLAANQVNEEKMGPLHSFTIDPAPEFLTDALAIEKARDTMVLDGYDLSAWQAVEDGRTKAPDKTIDVHLVRNAFNPNLGEILFVNQNNPQPASPRMVLIELQGDHLTCQITKPK